MTIAEIIQREADAAIAAWDWENIGERAAGALAAQEALVG